MKLICQKCREEIFADRNMVMLDNSLWKIVAHNAGISTSDGLCADCIELVMGRKIRTSDFLPSQISGVKTIPCNEAFLRYNRS